MIYFVDIENGRTYNGDKPYVHWFKGQQSTKINYVQKICVLTEDKFIMVSLPYGSNDTKNIMHPNNIFRLLDVSKISSDKTEWIYGIPYQNMENLYAKGDVVVSEGAPYGKQYYIHMIYIAASCDSAIEARADFFIDDNAYTIGADFYNEREELKIGLGNNGVEIPESIQKAIYDSNVLEESKDNIILNRKYKELLMDYIDILGNKGSYSSLLNSLKWFEYGDLVKIKEFWKTNNWGKTLYSDQEFQQILSNHASSMVNQYIKTTYMGLYCACQSIKLNKNGQKMTDEIGSSYTVESINKLRDSVVGGSIEIDVENDGVSSTHKTNFANAELNEPLEYNDIESPIGEEDGSTRQQLQIGVGEVYINPLNGLHDVMDEPVYDSDERLIITSSEDDVLFNGNTRAFQGANFRKISEGLQNVLKTTNRFIGEPIPELENVAFKWSRTDMAIKMALLGNFYETYFMPVHLDLIHSTIEDIVFSPSIKAAATAHITRTDHILNTTQIKCSVADGSVFMLGDVKVQADTQTTFVNLPNMNSVADDRWVDDANSSGWNYSEDDIHSGIQHTIIGVMDETDNEGNYKFANIPDKYYANIFDYNIDPQIATTWSTFSDEAKKTYVSHAIVPPNIDPNDIVSQQLTSMFSGDGDRITRWNNLTTIQKVKWMDIQLLKHTFFNSKYQQLKYKTDNAVVNSRFVNDLNEQERYVLLHTMPTTWHNQIDAEIATILANSYTGIGVVVPMTFTIPLLDMDEVINKELLCLESDTTKQWMHREFNHIITAQKTDNGYVAIIKFNLLCTRDREYDIRLQFYSNSGRSYVKRVLFTTIDTRRPMLEVYKLKTIPTEVSRQSNEYMFSHSHVFYHSDLDNVSNFYTQYIPVNTDLDADNDNGVKLKLLIVVKANWTNSHITNTATIIKANSIAGGSVDATYNMYDLMVMDILNKYTLGTSINNIAKYNKIYYNFLNHIGLPANARFSLLAELPKLYQEVEFEQPRPGGNRQLTRTRIRKAISNEELRVLYAVNWLNSNFSQVCKNAGENNIYYIYIANRFNLRDTSNHIQTLQNYAYKNGCNNLIIRNELVYIPQSHYMEPLDRSELKGLAIRSNEVLAVVPNIKYLRHIDEYEWIFHNASTMEDIKLPSIKEPFIASNNIQTPLLKPGYYDIKFRYKLTSEKDPLVDESNSDIILTNENGNHYIHIAWSNSENGKVDFTTSKSSGLNYDYVGVYVDDNQEDSTDYTKYVWKSLYTRDKGTGYNIDIEGSTYPATLRVAWCQTSNNIDESFTVTPLENQRYRYIGFYVDNKKEKDEQLKDIEYSRYCWVDLLSIGEPIGKEFVQTNINDFKIYKHIAWCNTYNNDDDSFTMIKESTDTWYNYIGISFDTNIKNPTNFQDYTWILVTPSKQINNENTKLDKAKDTYEDLPNIDVTIQCSKNRYYVHLAWCNNISQGKNFSVTKGPLTEYKYMGICINSNIEDPTNITDYHWVYIREEIHEISLSSAFIQLSNNINHPLDEKNIKFNKATLNNQLNDLLQNNKFNIGQNNGMYTNSYISKQNNIQNQTIIDNGVHQSKLNNQ